MNQILVTEKLYITPELKRKKKIYKIRFFLSVFLICLLCSYYIYAENDRNKSEEVSQQILADLEFKTTKEDTTTKNIVNDVLIVTLDEDDSDNVEEEPVDSIESTEQTDESFTTTVDGVQYTTDSILTIPSLDISYPVLSETSEELLKISLNKYWGNGPNEVGNYCIV